jgi:hypothetical protein
MLALLLAPPPAAACVTLPAPTFVEDATERALDHAPPSAPVVRAARFVRREPTPIDPDTCVSEWSSCDGLAWLELEVEGHDDRTDPEALGFLLRRSSGLALRSGPYVAESGVISLPFEDDGQALEAGFTVVAVDLGGNESEPSAPVEVTSPAIEVPPVPERCAGPGGCVGGSAAGLAPLSALGLRRRRR